jgi:hypothetical protein
MSTLDKDTLAMLTEEEREAIESSDDPQEEAAAQPAGDDGDAGDAGADKRDGPDGGDTAASGDAADEAGVAPADEADADGDDHGEPVPAKTAPTPQPEPLTPRYESKLPEDFDQQVKTLAESEDELKAKFRAGEIEFDEFELQRADILRQREALTIARTKAEISQEFNQQSAQQQWAATVNRFVGTVAAAEGLDYRTDTAKMADLDGFVRVLAGRPEHNDKSMEWFLAEAHRRVRALHGLDSPAPEKPEKPAAEAKSAPEPKPMPSRKPPIEAAPKTLAQVPGGPGPGDVSGEFADVLALDGMEFETAIARMTPAQRERFARVQ